MPKVSVIIPNYNHKKYLKKRLDSIFNQTYRDFEVILLDDKSTDGSVNTLKKYSTHTKVSHLIINSQNSGSPFKQWQKGINLTRGKYIWIAESDDWAEPRFLEKTVKILEENNDLGLVYTSSAIVTPDDEILGTYNYDNIGFDQKKWIKDHVNNGKYEIKNFLATRNTIPNASAVLFKAKTLQDNINFLKEYKLLGDWLLWIKVLDKSDVFYLSERLNYFRLSENNSRQHDTNTKKVLRIKEEMLIKNYLWKRKHIDRANYKAQLILNFKKAKKYLALKELIILFLKDLKILSIDGYFILLKYYLTVHLRKINWFQGLITIIELNFGAGLFLNGVN